MCLHPRKSLNAADMMRVLCQSLSHRTHSFDKERTIRICCLALVKQSVSVAAVVSGYRAAQYFTRREKGHNQTAECCMIVSALSSRSLLTDSKLFFFLKVNFVLNNSLNVSSVVASDL